MSYDPAAIDRLLSDLEPGHPARRQLGSLRDDRARLIFLVKTQNWQLVHIPSVINSPEFILRRWQSEQEAMMDRGGWIVHSEHRDFREAIDAAMEYERFGS